MSKKLFYAIFVMAVVAAVSVVVVSCKKDNENNTEKKSASADPMNEYLASFKEKLLSAQKGEETLSLEQAQRDLGNLLNYDFGDANYPTNVLQRDTLRTKLVIANGQVDLSQLANTYDAARELITQAYEKVNLPEKSVYVISCAINQKDNDLAEVELELTTRGFYLESKGMKDLIQPKTTIDQTDCWKVYHLYGRCDGSDAGNNDHTTILQLVYMNNLPSFSCPYGHVYYTDQTSGIFKATDYPETGTPTYNNGHRLWCGDYYAYEYGYVPPAEMSYYYNNLCDILDSEMAPYVPTYKLTSISCLIVQESVNSYAFTCIYSYAKPHCLGNND